MPDIKAYEVMAMLDLEADESDRLSKRIGELTESFESLAQIETDDIEPLVSVLDLRNIMREDASSKLVTRDTLLSNAPEQYDGYFQVPGTLV